MALEFIYYGADQSVQQRLFTNNIVTIGSDPSCDLCLPSLAPVHCRIYLSAQGYYLEELSGRAQINQTPGPGFIKQDDVLYVGPHAIRLGIRADAPAVPPPPVAAAKKEAKPKKSRPFRSCLLGCFGILFGLALIAFGIYIWWAQPSWATKYFFWRGEPYHATDEIPNPQRDAQNLANDEQAFASYQNQMKQLESQQGMGIGNLVQKEIKASEGGTLQTPQGARLEIPPGAIERDANVTFGPLVSPRTFQAKGDYILLTDVFSISVNGQNHYEFRTPVTLELPARTGSNPPDPSLVEPLYWDGSKWVPFSTRVEVTPGSIRFPIAHATDVVGGIKKATGWVLDTGSAAWDGLTQVTGTKAEIDSWSSAFGWDGTYKTTNFSIYFQKAGNTKYPGDIALADSAYPMAGGRKSGDVPLIVQDIGTYLELAHSQAATLGLKPASSPTGERHSVFLRSIGAFGETQIGGPVNIDNDFNGLPTAIDWPEFFKTTCVHEYFHILQDGYWTSIGSGNFMNSWVETSAQVFAELLRFKNTQKEHPNPFMTTNFYLESQPNFLSTPMNDEGKGSDKLFAYAWASFFIWMETESGLDGVTKSVFEKSSSNFDYSSIFNHLNSAIQEKKSSSNLSTEFRNFVDFYFHDDIWKNKLRSKNWWTDRAHTRALADSTGKEMYFRYPSANGTGAPIFYRERKIENLNHLTAQFYFVDASYMRNKVKAKVVVRFEDIKKSGTAVTLYSDDFENELPVKAATEKKELTLQSGKEEMLLFDRFGYIYGSSGVQTNPTRLSMTFVNDSKDDDGRDFKLRSWILLPPDNVVFDKVGQPGGPASYVISWNSSPLEAESKQNAPFKGYNIYRRKVGDLEWPTTPINTSPFTGGAMYEDKSLPDTKDYEYAVTVIDSFDQESKKSPLLSDDPFVGEWAGSIRLSQGHVVDFASMSEEDRKDYESIIKMANELEGIAKMGIPTSFKIEREATLYYLRNVKFAGFESDDSAQQDSKDAFKRISEHNLMFQPEPVDGKEVAPLYLTVEYEDVIQGSYTGGGATFSWSFKRKKKPESQPNPPIAEFQFPSMMFTACL